MANLIFENIICTNCGSSNVIFGNGIYTCNSCNSKFEKKQIDSKLFVELSIANQERQCTNFEKAKTLYEQIIKNYPDENLTDVYWGLFLCEQNVVFEVDGKGESFPSFYKISNNNALNNEKYLKAITYASIREIEKAKVFAELGEKIENARKMYYDIKNTTEPFDVFICFKNTDSNGKYTSDRQLAMDIYNEFNGKYNIFFSEKTLKNIKSNYREYEPNIYYGLYTSKVMLLICSKKEYLESQWLKNEWSRFSSINKQGSENKCIIPIFTDGFNPDDLPDSLWHNQGIFDDRKLISALETTLENIIHPVDKLEELRKEQERQKIEQERLLNKKIEELKHQNFVPNTTGVNLDNMINRGFQFLVDSEWDKAINQAEKVFDIDVSIPQGYIIEMMAENKLNTLKDFNKLDLSAFDCNNYKNALKYADQDYKIEILNLKNENIYNRAIKLIITDKLEAIKTFETILSYKDSQEKIEEIKQEIYQKALALKNQKSYTFAVNEFEKIKGYKDSASQILECKNLPIYNNALSYFKTEQFIEAIKIFSQIVNYKDSSQKIEECKNILYTNAKELMFNQKYDKAQTIFEQLSTFNDSKELAIECKNNHLYNKAKTLYEQAEFDKAIKCLNQIPNFLDSKTLIKEYEKEKRYFSLKNYYNDEIHTIFSLKRTLKNITKEDMYYKRTEEIVKLLKQELKSKEKFKKLSIIVVSGILVALTLIFTYTGVIVPSSKYNKAIDYVNCQELDKAKDIFIELDDYKDSQTMVKVINKYQQIELSSLNSKITNLTNLNAKIDVEFIVNHTSAKKLSFTKPTNNVSILLEATHDGVVYKNWDISYKGINVGKETKILIQLEPIYTITYSLNGGTNNSKNVDRYQQRSNNIILYDPTRIGYNFDGWYLDDSFTEKIESIQTGTAYNLNLYAKWSLTTYTITYELNGGTQNSQNPTTYTIEDSILLKEPLKDKYYFVGWYLESTFETSITNISNTAKNLTLYAKWSDSPIDYQITYNLLGGKNNEENPSIYNILTDTFTLKSPTKTGYTFEGWYLEDNYITQKTTIEKGSKGNITLFAKWEITTYTITYNLNGGKQNSQNPTTFTIEDLDISLQKPTKTSYSFEGWYLEENFNTLITIINENYLQDLILYAKWEKVQLYTRSGDTIIFGSYPQTKVTDSSITSALKSMAGTLPTSTNSYAWTDYGYYISSSVSSYMWYIDLEYNANKYRGVYFTSYRPYYTDYSSSTSNTYQYDNGYSTSTVYWFKYEPIKWTIKEESNGYATIVCNMLLDSQDWHYKDTSSTINGTTVYPNNYVYSHIRSWLNDTFYNTAFNELEQAIIQINTVYNNALTTGSSSNSYACYNTVDKIYLLSYKEATTYFTSDSLRQKKGTDYAKCQGLYVITIASYSGYSYWWLRSPYYDNSNSSLRVCFDGCIGDYGVNYTGFGVVPVLKIKLIEDDNTTNTTSPYTRSGDTITFGSYPQTKVTDRTITSVLTSKAGTLPTSTNSYSWTDYGYYISDGVSSYMWYIDLEYNANKYRGVYFTSYRPYYTGGSSTSNTYQENNGYSTSTVYWFKYEPITWTIKQELNGYATIVCNMILDSQDWHYKDTSSTINGTTVYANNYEYSHIRSWLNDTFYNTAFNELEQAIIQTTTVDNSASSTASSSNSYACNNTSDKIYLLSYKEATTYFTSNSQREKQGTDYAKCQGLDVDTNSYYGNSYWWLRSPSNSSWYLLSVSDVGNVCGNYVYDAGSGVVPALKIKL